MATLILPRRLTRLSPLFTPTSRPSTKPQRRTFLPGLTLPTSSAPQRFTETRTLPHSAYRLAALIKDIDAYSSYLPYCVSSIVTQTSAEGLPTRATLGVGFGPVREEFESRVFCRREAAGSSGPAQAAEDAGDWAAGAQEREDLATYTVTADGGGNQVFERCYTRWSVRGLEGGGSRLGLDIEFCFRSPVYAALAQGVLPKVGGEMIRAFEERAGAVLGVRRKFE